MPEMYVSQSIICQQVFVAWRFNKNSMSCAKFELLFYFTAHSPYGKYKRAMLMQYSYFVLISKPWPSEYAHDCCRTVESNFVTGLKWISLQYLKRRIFPHWHKIIVQEWNTAWDKCPRENPKCKPVHKYGNQFRDTVFPLPHWRQEDGSYSLQKMCLKGRAQDYPYE